MTRMAQITYCKLVPPQKHGKSVEEFGALFYLDLPEHLDALPDVGLEALEHVRVPGRQSLQRVLQKREAESARLHHHITNPMPPKKMNEDNTQIPRRSGSGNLTLIDSTRFALSSALSSAS
jgi:hypothetical protein